MIRFLEQNGYDVSYVSGIDVATDPTLLPQAQGRSCPSVTTSTGSQAQRKNVTDARDAGVQPGVLRRQRRLLEDTAGAVAGRHEHTRTGPWSTTRTPGPARSIDPVEPTPTWRDPRFGDLGYGFGPENALIGTQFQANSVDLAIKVSAEEGKLRIWRGTRARLAWPAAPRRLWATTRSATSPTRTSTTATDRPGLIRMSTTTGPTPST